MIHKSKHSLVTFLLFLMATLTVSATDFTVNSLADTNTGTGTSGTLRYCINEANAAGVGPHTITFDTGGIGTILLGSNLPTISSPDITIDGTSAGGVASVIIDAGSGDISRPIFSVSASGTNATFRGMTTQDSGYRTFNITGSPMGVLIEDIIVTNSVTTCDCTDAAVHVANNAEDLTIRNVTMTEGQTGQYGIYIGGTSENVIIDGFNLSKSDPGIGIRFVGAANNVSILNTTLNLLRDGGTSSGDHGVYFQNTASNITINELTVNDADSNGLYFNSTTNTIVIDDFEFNNENGSTASKAIHFYNVATNVDMSNITIDQDYSLSTDDGDYGIYFRIAATNISLDTSIMHDTERIGFYIGGVATDVSITNSTFDNFNGWTSNTMLEFGGVVNGITLTNVDIDLNLTDNGNSLDDGNYGIYFNSHLNQDITKNAIFTDVTINQADSHGLYTRLIVNNLTIDGSSFTGNSEGSSGANYGIEFDNNYQKSNITIQNSTFTDLGSAAMEWDMRGTDNTSNLKILNNTISGTVASSYAGYGIWLYYNNAVVDLDIIGNTFFDNAAEAVSVREVDGVNISQNNMYNNLAGIDNLAGNGNNDLELADGDISIILNSVNTGVDTYDVTFTTPPIAVCNPCEVEFFANQASDSFNNGRTYVQTETGLSGGTTYTRSINSGGENTGFWTTTLKSNNLNNSVSEFGNAYAISPIGPGGVTVGLDYWFDPSASVTTSGSSVTQWRDRAFSGNNPVLGQGNAALYPTFNSGTAESNFNPYIDFTTNTRLHQTVTGSSYAESHSVFAAYRNNEAVAGSRYATFLRFSNASNSEGGALNWGFGYNNYTGENNLMIHYITAPFSPGTITLPVDQYNQYNVSKPWETGTTGIVSAIIDQVGSQTIMGFDGNESINDLAINNSKLTPRNYLTLGGGNTYGQAGWGQEIIEYEVVLSQTDREKVNSYLAIKYGTTLSHNYLASDGSTVWNLGSGFDNDIAGIARDDNGVLNQKQSRSVNTDAMVTIGLGSIETTNAANTNTFTANKDFLLWGNDDASANFQTTELPTTALALQRLGREWKVSNTGGVNNVTLSFSNIKTSPLVTNLELFVDTDGDGDFTDATVITGGILSGGTVTFTGVNLNDEVVFTLGATNPAPGGVSNSLSAWYRADISASTTLWEDQSPNSLNAVGRSLAGGPTGQSVNFNPSIPFAGASNNEAYDIPEGLFNDGNTSIAAFSVGSGTGGTWFSGGHTNATRGMYFRNTSATASFDFPARAFTQGGVSVEPRMMKAIYNAASHTRTIEFNNSVATSNSVATLNYLYSSYLQIIGHNISTGGNKYNGNLPELIFYNDVDLVTQEIERIESYMAIKYGLSLTHNYYASDWNGVTGTTLWTLGNGYDNDIAGIGKDDLSVLNQKQSKSVNDDAMVTIGLGTIETTNAANTNTFTADKDFLIWGNDDASTDLQTGDLPTGAIALQRLGREWKVQKTGAVDNVTISFSNIAISSLSKDYQLFIDPDGDGDFSNGTVITGGVESAGTVTFTGVNLVNSTVFTLGVTTPAPGGIAGGLTGWYRADLGTDVTVDAANLSQWNDQSNSGNNAVQLTIGNQPTFSTTRAMNFNPVVEFATPDVSATAANQDYLDFTGIPNVRGAFWVAINDDFTANYKSVIYGYHSFIGGTGGRVENGSYISGDTWRKEGGSASKATQWTGTPDFFGVQIDDGKLVDNIGSYQLSSPERGWDGTMGEVILYTATQTPTELLQIESYLAIKYGITLEQSPAKNYLTSTAAVIWDATTNATYSNDIAGIGRDDASALTQTQSKSINDDAIVAMGLGTIEATNAANINTFTTDNNFILWGNNDGSEEPIIVYTPNSFVPVASFRLMERVWKIAETGTVGTVQLNIPDSYTVSHFIVDIDGDGDFNTGTPTELSLVDDGNGNLTVDYDFEDGDVFTFGKEQVGPGGVFAHMNMWLKANKDVYTDGNSSATDGTPVEFWKDNSSNNNSAVQGAGNIDPDTGIAGTLYSDDSRPTFVESSFNYNPAISYDGLNSNTTGDWMDFEDLTDNQILFIVAMRNSSAATDYDHFLYGSDSGNAPSNTKMYHGGNNSFQNGAYHPNIGWRKNGAGASYTTTYTEDYPDIIANEYANNTVMAANMGIQTTYTSRKWDGNIQEIILYNSAITTTERNRIESYLALKYGITLDQSTAQNYIASDGVTKVWDATANAIYKNDIAGIARDDNAGLNQKQSKSVNTDAIVSIGLGSITTSNTANVNTFAADKNFLIWGNDGASTAVVNSGIPSTFGEKIARNWLVIETGTVGIGTTLVQIPNSAVAGFSNTTELMLFVADDAGFTTNMITVPLVQNGVNWEAAVDFNDAKYFTFGIIPASDFMRHGKTFQGSAEQPMKF